MLLECLETKEERVRVIDKHDREVDTAYVCDSAGHVEVVKELLSHNCDCNMQ